MLAEATATRIDATGDTWDELIVSHWFKRLTTIEMTVGDADMHLQRFARLARQA